MQAKLSQEVQQGMAQELHLSPTGPEWVEWKRSNQTRLLMVALRESIQGCQDQWANGAYQDAIQNAEGRGAVLTLDKLVQWIDGIDEQPRQDATYDPEK